MSISLALRDTSLGLVPRFGAVLLAGGIAAAALFGTASAASAAPVIPADEPDHGLFTISANAPSVSPGETGFVTVHREGGTAGIVTVRVSSGDLSPELAALIRPIDETLSWPDGDATEQTVPIVFVDHDIDVSETGPSDLPTTTGRAADEQLQASETGVVSLAHAMAAADEDARPSLTVSLSAPTGGAAIGTPSSVSIVINAPPTTTPVTGGGDGGQPAESTTTTPGRQPGSQPGTTSPIGARESLADTGVQAIVPFIGATTALIAGLSTVMVIRRRRAIASTAAAATMEE
jgi:hypothetical protein